MRQKKVKDANINNLIKLGVYINQIPIEFKTNNPISVEVGSGKGKFITSLANDNPQIEYLAIEKEINVCYLLALKKKELNLTNLYIVHDDANHLKTYLDGIKINNLYLNFSDPWPKPKHHKRRLTYKTKLILYKELLSSEGLFAFRTDHLDFFNDSKDYFVNNGFIIIKEDLDLPKGKYMTEYEEKKRESGPIYQLVMKVK